MSVLTPEQLQAMQKANLDAFFSVSTKAYESLERLIDLNRQAIKTTLSESQTLAQRALSTRDPQQLLAMQAELAQPSAEKILSYARHVQEIVSSAQADLVALAETQYEEHNARIQAWVDNAARNAPAGSETAVAAVKSAMAAANTTFETLQKASRQAVDIAESNFSAATTAATKAAQQATEQAARSTRKSSVSSA